MKLVAQSRASQMAALCLLTLGFVINCHGQQVVSCAAPPGGQITCETNQVASCAVNQQQNVNGRCQNKPPGMTAKEDVQAWTLTQVTGETVTRDQLKESKYKVITSRAET